MIGLTLAVTAGEPASPSLPGAVVAPPSWLVGNCPFDIAKFFEMPPAARNAAPLYLDALLEFAPETAACFADSPEVRSRKDAAADRVRQWSRIDTLLRKDPKSIGDAELDAFLAEHDAGFRRLAEAQKRPACLFATGISLDSSLAHGQPMRQVMRIAGLRASRSLARGDLDRPLEDLRLVLRMVRDIRPRGILMCQLVANAIAQTAYVEIVRPVLAHPRLTPGHCDRIIAALTAHLAQSVDQYDVGRKAEYVMARVALRDAAARPGDPDRRGAEAARIAFVRAYFDSLSASGEEPNADRIAAFLRRVEAITAKELDRQVAILDGSYRDMDRLASVPFASRIREVDALVGRIVAGKAGEEFPSRLAGMIQPTWAFHLQAMARDRATLHAALSLSACRRWELTTDGPPLALAEVIEAAGLPRVPLDPYDDQPLRFRRASGRYLVYSVGKDGRDDGGLVDSDYDRRPGDLLYRLP